MAADIFLNAKELSVEYPYYRELLEQYFKIHSYKRYFEIKSINAFSGIIKYELKFLPLGESVGYDNHSWKTIRDIEEVLNALNEVASQKT